jgi:hypothetical protein
VRVWDGDGVVGAVLLVLLAKWTGADGGHELASWLFWRHHEAEVHGSFAQSLDTRMKQLAQLLELQRFRRIAAQVLRTIDAYL